MVTGSEVALLTFDETLKMTLVTFIKQMVQSPIFTFYRLASFEHSFLD